MDPEKYQVEVLHFINPYLIWVEVPGLDPKNENKSCFEQIGIYGTLPLEMTMDPVEDILETKRSQEWMPAAMVLMKILFAEATEIYFQPIYIDHRSTIFDDNIHKYGEIILKKPNGNYRLLSKLLVKSGYALYSEHTFEDELKSRSIKTKLSYYLQKDIVKQLEKKSKAQIDKQTKIFQAAQHIETALTKENLEAHNKRTKNKTNNFEEMFQRKLQDLQMCKDADLVSIGRASKKKETDSDYSSPLQRKLRLLRATTSTEAPNVVNYCVKQRIKDLNALQKPSDAQKPQDVEPKNGFNHENLKEDLNDLKKQTETEKPIILESDNSVSEQDPPVNAMKKLQMLLKKRSTNTTDDCNVIVEDRKTRADTKKPKSSQNKLPNYDVHKEARIAFGPPGTNFNILQCKIVPKDSLKIYYQPELIEESIPMKKEKDDISMKKEKDDIFEAEDSDVDRGIALQQKILNRVPDKTASSDTDSALHKKKSLIRVLDKALSSDSDIIHKSSDATSKVVKDISENISTEFNNTPSSNLKRRLRLYRETMNDPRTLFIKRIVRECREKLFNKTISTDSSDTSIKDSSTSIEEDRFKNYHKNDEKKNTSKDLDSDDESISLVIEKLNSEYEPFVSPQKGEHVEQVAQLKNNVNPFKNADSNISKFVEKLVTPVLMVHSKMNKRFQPIFNLRDVPFNTHIQIILRNMSIEQPMMLQSITWASILRGYSTFLVAPKKSGKTMGYLPAICRLVSDQDSPMDGGGPMSIIVCATSKSVAEVEKLTKLFFGKKERVLAIYSGMNELDITISLLNGCDILICTPAILVRLLQIDLGVDLRRLTSFVLDDCERLTEVFSNEIKFFLFKIKEMLKTRVPQEVKVQYVVSSRVWCDFMESLSKKAPDTVICIGAFQECVLYSKANTTASFVTKENKIKSVLEFFKDVDHSKRSVIVCRTDEEIAELEKALSENNYVVFACNSDMTVQNLYNLRGSWDDYQEPVIGPILMCLDGNLTHLNVTDAHYLVHYSLPCLFSEFCKRFSALNDNYPSIFKEDNEGVKIKILLEDSNVEQLPKILNFIKRCTTEIPTALDEICEQILVEKDKIKAAKLLPICNNLLALGECPDFWYCQDYRHSVVKDFDEPQDWMPKEGMITFKIVHYHTAVFYSARLLSHNNKGQTHKYPQHYNMLAMKISMYFSRESNKRLHTQPEVGDVCAISIKQNFFVRCQVVKILNYYQNGKPNCVLVRLTDEEKLETTRDIYLYYLPPELQTTQTHVVQIRLANVKPKDKDVSFSNLAMEELKMITEGEEDLYMRGKISLSLGNCVILDSVEACRDLSTLNKTVVLHDFKKILLEKHAQLNEEHLQKLNKLCVKGGMKIQASPEASEVLQSAKNLPTPQWAHLEKDDLSAVFFASAEDPSTFFVRLVKFEDSCSVLVKDIQKYVAENCDTLTSVDVGDIVLAKLPDYEMFERARIDEILNDDKVKCFFVDQGDWREVSKKNLIAINKQLIIQLPFQAIECRLIGVKPPGENWTEFARNWFTNCFEDNTGNLKQIFVKYFTKERSQYTGGHKYGVVLVDTNSEQDVIINEFIMEVNLAQEEDSEIEYLNNLDLNKVGVEIPKELSDIDEADDSWDKVSEPSKTPLTDDSEQPKYSLNNVFNNKPIRSVPLVGSDESETSEHGWQINMTEDFMEMFKPTQKNNTPNFRIPDLPAIKNAVSASGSELSDYQMPCKNLSAQANKISQSETDSSTHNSSSILVIPSTKIKQLDSDDYTSSESATEKDNFLKEISTKIKPNHTEMPVKEAVQLKPDDSTKVPDLLRKPKVLWHQKKETVTIKILLIGVENYNLIFNDRELNFYAEANDTEYGFDLLLYGIIDKKNAIHSNKGQYIWIHLPKIIKSNWLTLTRSGGIKKWIVYDVDSIDVDASDVESDNDMSRNVIKGLCDEHENSDSEDEEFIDDVDFGYSW